MTKGTARGRGRGATALRTEKMAVRRREEQEHVIQRYVPELRKAADWTAGCPVPVRGVSSLVVRYKGCGQRANQNCLLLLEKGRVPGSVQIMPDEFEFHSHRAGELFDQAIFRVGFVAMQQLSSATVQAAGLP